MPSPLLPRILLIVSPVALGCTQRADPLPGSGPVAPGEAPTSTAPSGEMVQPKAPLTPRGPVPVGSSPAPQPGDTAYGACGVGFFVNVPGRTGGSYRTVGCYQPAEPGAECVARTSPSLRRLVRMDMPAECVESGPQRQSDPKTGAPQCCYEFGAAGEGRPLFVSREQRVAGRRSERTSPAWG